jgi:hypothetical protein
MRLSQTPWLSLFAVALLPSCGDRTELEVGPCPIEGSFSCVAPAADPCGAPILVQSACDATTHAYVCPEGAWPYARADARPDACLPFSDPSGPIRWLGGSLVRVPTDDGRCLWIAEEVETQDGTRLRNVAFAPDRKAPFATCPTAASIVGPTPASIVALDGGDDPSLYVQIASSLRFGGRTQVVYRLFRADATATFGVTLLGGGLGHWDPASQRIVVPGPGTLPFSTALGLGDAALVTPTDAYVWGCSKPNGLTNGCLVARFDAGFSMQLFGGSAGWLAGAAPAQAATVFDAGPWISSVVPDPAGGSGLLHVFAIGFGGTLESHTAPLPEGPWTSGPTLATCALPPGDGMSFCAGPVVHEELSDPTRPGEIVVSHGLGSTADDQTARLQADPQAYWTRLVWLDAP